MMEQELASIVKFVTSAAGHPREYYCDEVLEGFELPAVYYPLPRLLTGGDSLEAYGVFYTLDVKFFAKSSAEAYEMGLAALTAIRGRKCWIPLVEMRGCVFLDDEFWIKSAELRVLEAGVAQLTLKWDVRRCYAEEEAEKVTRANIKMERK